MTTTIDLAAVKVGTVLPPLTVHFTRQTLVQYAGASTDFNPIHYSEHYATKVGLPNVIAHGMLTMASALRVVTDWVGDPGRVKSYFVRFTRPVVVPDDETGAELVISGTVTAIEGTIATIALEAISQENKVLGMAKADVDLG